MSQTKQRKKSLKGTIVAAELAVDEEDFETAENALLDALGAVRKRKGGVADD